MSKAEWVVEIILIILILVFISAGCFGLANMFFNIGVMILQ
jgi:hypothetical protein